MKTSASQFDLMVTFMKQHGDLSKPSANARGRISHLKKWEELANLLNSDGSGDSKTTEKWKKVWSDYKNNTKKKAARLHRAASGTGGGPAMLAKLTDLEQRVLNIIGVQVATGLAVEEAGLSQEIHRQPNPDMQDDPCISTQTPHPTECTQEPVGRNTPPLDVSSPPPEIVMEEVQGSQPWNGPGPSTRPHITPISIPCHIERVATPLSTFAELRLENTTSPSPSRTQINIIRPEPSQSGHTPPHRRVRSSRTRGTPRRLARPAHTEQAAQQFLQAEEYWRKFKEDQHRDYMDLRREQNRIREMEVQAQKEWQAVALRGLDILEKFVNKF